MHLDIGVVGVGLAREQSLDLTPLRFLQKRLHGVDAFLFRGGVIFHLAEFDEGYGVFQFAFELTDGAEPVLQLGALAHDFLRLFGVIPQVGVFDLGVEFGEATRGGLDVKDASSAVPWTARCRL